ncbi:GNAT family N-acetyltransferase [Aliivibrio kagoshimensis]|uniref:GNAT family N-acetyltransferase n=1 Tax=Aliivibrio kagoshimensis TaxID=2910230 RepID=UPI003D0B5016
MKIQTITWQDALPIRHQVLWPEKEPMFCFVDGDETGLHYGVFKDEALVCVASIYLDGNSARLRKFATLSEYQGEGIGTAMVTFIMKELSTLGVRHFWCDARTTAFNFYLRLGLDRQGEAFMKSGIQYYKMSGKL